MARGGFGLALPSSLRANLRHPVHNLEVFGLLNLREHLGLFDCRPFPIDGILVRGGTVGDATVKTPVNNHRRTIRGRN